MEKRNKFLVLSLLLMLAVSATVYQFSGGETGIEIDKAYFRPADSKTVDLITLRSSGDSIELKFENNRWKVNGRWEADDRMIKVLLATLLQAEPRRPVAASQKDSVIRELERRGTEVALSSKDEKQVQFRAGGNSLKGETWFMKKGEDQPYVITIPGYHVYVAGILQMDESGWRNKRIFDFNWRNFKMLTARYSKEPAEGFEVEWVGRFPVLKDMPNADTTRLNDYIDQVSLLFAERFIPRGQQHTDSIAATSPVVTITVRDIANRTYTLELFNPRRSDAEVFGRLADGQMVALNKNEISAIVRRRAYFSQGK